MLGREAIERLDEDAPWALQLGAEKSADSHLKTNPVSENRFLGEAAIVAAMHSPGLVAANGAVGVEVRRGDAESQSVIVDVSTDQAAADGSAQKQWVPPTRAKS